MKSCLVRALRSKLVVGCFAVACVWGCKFEVTYPDSFAVPDSNQDAEADVVGPDAHLDTTEDTGPSQCFADGDCNIKLGEPGACKSWRCAAGQCELVAGQDWVPCDDLNLCTSNDQCDAGVCTGIGYEACPDDGDPCTKDFCDPTTGYCTSQPLESCGGCVPEGELLGMGGECCWPARAINKCQMDCVDRSGCSAGCCEGSTLACANTSDGVCQGYETACTSADCGLTCLMEGETGVAPVTCCDPSLTIIQWFGGESTPGVECASVIGGMVACARCGDGICGTGEDYCGCPKDCDTIVTNPCGGDGDCPIGESCIDQQCVYCGVEQCNNYEDDDCDGSADETPCQTWQCGFNTSDFPTLPISQILPQGWALSGSGISTLGTVFVGTSICNIDCVAPLVVKDSNQSGPAHLELMDGKFFSDVGCQGSSSSTMTCNPAMKLGATVMVWGHLNMEGPVPRLELDGFCEQDTAPPGL